MITPFTAATATPLTDEEVVAALAAVHAYLAAEHAAQPLAATNAHQRSWHDGTKLVIQGLQPLRTAVPPRWSTIERLRRRTGGYGVTGL